MSIRVKATLLSVYFVSETPALDIHDLKIPQPAILNIDGTECRATWYIEGYIGLLHGKSYFNDIREKICLILGGVPAKIIPDNVTLDYTTRNFTVIIDPDKPICRLADFRHIEDLRYFKKARTYSGGADTDDKIFDDLRRHAYMLHQEGLLTEERLDEHLHSIVKSHNNYKKARYKVKNVYKWVIENYIGSDQKRRISRQKNANLQSQAISGRKYESFKIYMDFLTSTGGSKSINELAKALKITWRTAKKYLQKYMELATLSLMPSIRHIRVQGRFSILHRSTANDERRTDRMDRQDSGDERRGSDCHRTEDRNVGSRTTEKEFFIGSNRDPAKESRRCNDREWRSDSG
jgi:hypothetical protein